MPLIKAEHVRQFEEQGKDYSDSEHRAGRREAVETPSRIVLWAPNRAHFDGRRDSSTCQLNSNLARATLKSGCIK